MSEVGIRSTLVAVCGALLGFLAGCSCGQPAEVASCEGAEDCADGLVCIDGVCQALSDAGVRDANREDRPVGCRDNDGDGFDGLTEHCSEGTDCDDSDADISPDGAEVCADEVDNDCDAETDESDCVCRRGQRVVCYTGPIDTRGVGLCRVGVASCVEDGMPGDCRGEVVPVPEASVETCDGVDNDCDGDIDEELRNACGECSSTEPTELCGNELDDDCDGLVDEECNCDYRCECPTGTSCECTPPTNQPCYEGPFGTDGRGLCHGGRRDCVVGDDGSNLWGECGAQVLPATECDGGVANGQDDDCDGMVDEGCADADEDGSPWPEDCDDTDASVHPGAEESCNGRDDNCDGIADEGVTNGCGACFVPATAEECGNGVDDDCNGTVDEGCSCTTGATQDCYSGPPDTDGVASCRAGTQRCIGLEFTEWTDCAGEILPQPELCNGEDDDCDGEVDERWAVGSNACGFCDGTELCDGEDNDCDGLVDEGVANACGECAPEPTETCNGEDDDCDGLVDEGVVNACGTCPPEPCYTEIWETPADCGTDGRLCDSVEEHPDHPGSITLGQSTSSLPFIYIAVTGRNEVAQLDTDTGVKNWQVPSHGRYPSRTAVAFDGSVWVGNRAYTGSNPSDPAQSNVVHLDVDDGHLICRADVTGVARAVAIDAHGDVWAGTFNGRQVWHISGTDVIDTPDGPRCRVINTIDVGQAVYGITVDPDGFVWTSSSPTVKLDTRDYSFETVANPSHYGIAPDGRGQIWFGGWRGGGTVHAVRSADGSILETGVNSVTAVTVHPDGSAWGSRYGTNEIIGFDGETGVELCRASLPPGSGSNPHGVAVDRMGRLWMPSRFGSGAVNVFTTDCGHVATYTVDAGQELYSYSDMTGHLLRTFTAPEGLWTQTYDSGYPGSYWVGVEWDSDEPPDTEVEVTVYGADDPADFGSAMACGPFTASPIDLGACPWLASKRYLRVEVRLRSTASGARPIVHEVRALWAY